MSARSFQRKLLTILALKEAIRWINAWLNLIDRCPCRQNNCREGNFAWIKYISSFNSEIIFAHFSRNNLITSTNIFGCSKSIGNFIVLDC